MILTIKTRGMKKPVLMEAESLFSEREKPKTLVLKNKSGDVIGRFSNVQFCYRIEAEQAAHKYFELSVVQRINSLVKQIQGKLKDQDIPFNAKVFKVIMDCAEKSLEEELNT